MTDHEHTPEAGLSEEAIAAAVEEIAESVMGNSYLESYLSDEERDDLRSDIAIEATRVLTGLRLPSALNFAAGVEAAAKLVDEMYLNPVIARAIRTIDSPSAAEPSEAEVETALLIALAQANIPADVQELLVRGDPMRGVLPHALVGAYAHVRASQQGGE
jgi:hypothetical protein